MHILRFIRFFLPLSLTFCLSSSTHFFSFCDNTLLTDADWCWRFLFKRPNSTNGNVIALFSGHSWFKTQRNQSSFSSLNPSISDFHQCTMDTTANAVNDKGLAVSSNLSNDSLFCAPNIVPIYIRFFLTFKVGHTPIGRSARKD